MTRGFSIGYGIDQKYQPIWVSASVSDLNQDSDFGRTLFQSPIFTLFDKFVKVQLYRHQKSIFQELSSVKNISLVSYAAGYIFPLDLLLPRGLCLSMKRDTTYLPT